MMLDLISDVILLKNDKTGRVDQLGFQTGNGNIEYISAKNFRTLIGFDMIRSTLFECDLIGSKVVQQNQFAV